MVHVAPIRLDGQNTTEHDVEPVVKFPFFNDIGAYRIVLPGASAYEFPDVSIGEAPEEAQVLDSAKLVS